MRRLHLFEFGDQPWFPAVLRDAETAYLATVYRFLPLPKAWAEKISTVLAPGESVRIVDLCSGAGGPIQQIMDELRAGGHPASAILTDLYPNRNPVFTSEATWFKSPIDAARVPPELDGVRTMFNAFHHFRDAKAKAILTDAFARRRTIGIFEVGSGTVAGVLAMLIVPFTILALMPLVRPLRWQYLLFTYLIPVLPLVVLWDGVVSMLRIYSPEQMKELTKDLEAPDYQWDAGRIRLRGFAGGLPYLVGRAMAKS